jgi:hypothetical protein
MGLNANPHLRKINVSGSFFTMIFTQIFGTIGLLYITMGITNYQSSFSDKLFKKIWGQDPPPAFIYTRTGILSILCGLLLDFCFWLAF